ncbi:hypothetical protein [Flagellimonas algicola]|uniref:Uncharacterized protein n=1 Tax=Flagellimonas algicola TaxID=2583815 RepID=A0ABY2WN98_9FLAO|nr:hypothetical protein [Allomuricauda algicola]TMU56477.1 hypothetical protein FGG15_02760 [Allomuricauda algicola]
MFYDLGRQFADTLGVSGSKKTGRKRSYRYRVVVSTRNGRGRYTQRTISKHYTLKNANKKARGIRGARVVPIGKQRK